MPPIRLLIAAVTTAFVCAGPQPALAQNWIGTWEAPAEFTQQPAIIAGQTLRNIVHIDKGGYTFRVRLSNVFGTAPLVIGSAHFARALPHAAGAPATPCQPATDPVIQSANTVSGSDRRLTFAGSAGATIAPGAEVFSDPVNLGMNSESDVAISLYLPNPTAASTAHFLTSQQNFLSSAGDFSAASTFPVGQCIGPWYFLTGIEVQAPPGASTVVTLGDSITELSDTYNGNNRYPDRLGGWLRGAYYSGHHTLVSVVNAGMAGNGLVVQIPGEQTASVRFDRDVLSVSGVKYVIVLLGINDIGFSNPKAIAPDLIAADQELIRRAHAAGLKIFGGTITPFYNANNAVSGLTTYYSDEGEQTRQTVNQWIRTSGAFDAVLDFDAAIRDPKEPRRMLPLYDSTDHLHPSDAGFAKMARSIDLRLFQ